MICKNWFCLIIGFDNHVTMLAHLIMHLTVITVNFMQLDQRLTVFNPYFCSIYKRNQWKPFAQWPVMLGNYVCIARPHRQAHTLVLLPKYLDINNSLVLFPLVFLTPPQNVETSNWSKIILSKISLMCAKLLKWCDFWISGRGLLFKNYTPPACQCLKCLHQQENLTLYNGREKA